MNNNENLNKEKECGRSGRCSENYEVAFEEEKAEMDSSKPCDSSNPDYPWASCGIDKKPKDNEEK